MKNKIGFARDDLNGGYRDLMLSALYEDITTGLRIIGEIQATRGVVEALDQIY